MIYIGSVYSDGGFENSYRTQIQASGAGALNTRT